MAKTITQLPAAQTVSGSAVVATDNAAGTETQKVTLAEIAALASYGNQIVAPYGLASLTQEQQDEIKEGTIVTVDTGERYAYSGTGNKTQVGSYVLLADISPSWNDITDIPADFPPSAHTHVLADITDFPVATANGQVVTWDSTASAWVAGAGGGSLPVATNDGDVVQWDSATSAYTATNALTLASITFPDASVQSTAGLPIPSSAMQGDVLTYDTGNWVAQAPSGGGVPNGTNNSDILYWNSTNSAWETTPGNPGTMPTGSTTGDTIKWDSSLGYYVSTPSPVPTSANTNDILAWNGSAWAAVMPSTPGLPSGNSGQYLRYDGVNWQGDRIKVPSWNSSDTYNPDDVVAYGGIWRAISSGSNQTPAPGSSYWENIGLAPLAAGTSNGDVLTWDSAMSIWTAAAPTGIPAPSMPNDGDVLTYDSTTSAWVAEAPSGGGGISSSVARLTSQFVTNAGAGNDGQRVTGLNVTIDEGTWLIQGLLIVTDAAGLGSVPIDSRLEKEGNTNLYGAFHFKSPDEVACNVVYDQITNMQQIATGAIAGSPPQQRIPFSALAVLDAEQGPTDTIHVRLADGGDNGDDVGCEAGSWIVAIKLS